jgi:outer membrane protein OmpA-like peptidoglycan-associated protein
MVEIKIVFIGIIMLVLVAFAETHASSDKMLLPPSLNRDNGIVQAKERNVILYRISGDEDYTLNIKIDNKIVGSLLPNHYTQIKVHTEKIIVGVVERGTAIYETSYDLPILDNSVESIYFRVYEISKGRFILILFNPETARNEISSLHLKSSVVDQYASKFSPPEVKPPIIPPAVLKSITVSADTLFPLNSSYFRPESIAKINTLIDDIVKNDVKVSALRITGYTDVLGDDDYNLWLSQRRAKRVADYLQAHGLNMPMEIIGLGEANPISEGCEKLTSSRLYECLQSDRRVVIDLIGQK